MSNNGWRTVKLGDVADLLTGFAFKSKEYSLEKGIKVLRGENIGKNILKWNKTKYWDRDIGPYHKFLLKENDLVLAMDGNVGKNRAMVRKKNLPLVLAQRVCALRAKKEFSQLFLKYVILNNHFHLSMDIIKTGVAIPHISLEQIANYNFSIPNNFKKQHDVGTILNQYDNLIENNIERINSLEESAKRLYEEWFVKFQFPGHENVPMVDSELGPIPEGWEIRNLTDIVNLTYGFPFKSKLFTSDGIGEKVIRIRDIIPNETKTFSTEVAEAKHVVENGDVLVGMDGIFHIGKWAAGEAYLNQRVVRFRPKNEISPYLIYQLIKKPISHLNSSIVGTTVAHLSAKHINEIKIVYPDESIVRKMTDLLNPMYDEEIACKVQNQQLRAARDLLLPKLISGQLDVSELDIATEEMVTA